MIRPLISVVIPTYNRIYYLGELLESLLKQTLHDFEIIIVNDCGEKIDIVKKAYSDLDITIVDLPEKLNHVHARNEGVKRARANWIMLMDDDDLIVPSHMKTMLEALEDYDLAYSDAEILNYEFVNNRRIPKNRILFAYELDLEFIRRFSTFIPSGCLYRKAIHDEIGLFDPEMHHYWDWDFFLRTADKYRIKRVPAAGVLYDFSTINNNQSKLLTKRKLYLEKLSRKHSLGQLPVENFYTLLNRPEAIKKRAKSKIVWDGQPFFSRIV